MKLKELIRHIDPFTDFELYHEDNKNSGEPTWEGSMLDMPWWYLDCELDTARDYEAISCSHKTSERGVNIPVMIINLKG